MMYSKIAAGDPADGVGEEAKVTLVTEPTAVSIPAAC
jgi:hypothetical protein